MKNIHMDQRVTDRLSLDTLPIGWRARIVSILGGRNLHRRLMGLGLRVGSEVEILHHRRRGVVVACAGNRIALGSGVVEKLLIEPLPQEQES